jgi:hypothetical protein
MRASDSDLNYLFGHQHVNNDGTPRNEASHMDYKVDIWMNRDEYDGSPDCVLYLGMPTSMARKLVNALRVEFPGVRFWID